MNLRSIKLQNYGLFRGEHVIDLSVRPRKPILLFGGKNGAGKTTLLEALRLCLYGPAALGDRLSYDVYTALLAERIHCSPTLVIQPSFASVSLTFDYADVGRVRLYEVIRSWERATSGRVIETLRVLRDGEELSDLTAEQWQDFVRDLVPPGVSSLFFFDGEKIQHLAEDSADHSELALSVKSLLGTDIVERLHADLNIYKSRIAKATQSGQNSKLEELSQAINEAERNIEQLRAERDTTQSSIDDVRGRISQVEQRIASEGGAFSKNRDSIISRREEAKAKVSTLEQSIRHLCQGILPFAFAPDLCALLRDTIVHEEELKRVASGRELLEQAKSVTIQGLDAFGWVPSESRLSHKTAALVAANIKQLIESSFRQLELPAAKNGRAAVHELSATESRQILHWLQQSLEEIPERLKSLSAELDEAHGSLHKSESLLKRVPADDILAPMISDIQELNRQYGELTNRILTESERIRSEENRLADLRRKLAQSVDHLHQGANQIERAHMISRVQSALDRFRNRMLERKIRDLEQCVTACFNQLARKTDAVKRVSISSKDFAVVLHDRDGNAIPKERLSAGEKQIYAIAMLWALARTSGRPLPVIIDTPLGRLDSDHRKLLVNSYFPFASHQVIVLSTDTEVDKEYFDALRPFVATAYRLDYDMADHFTRIRRGYFFEERNEAHEAKAH